MIKSICPICDTTSRTWKTIDKFEVFKCPNCGHGFIFPMPKDLSIFYDKDYAKTYMPGTNTEAFRDRFIQYITDAELLEKYYSEEHCRVLDFGCSTGIFLTCMKDKWEKAGFEVNNYELKHLKANTKSMKIFSKIEEIYGKFDIVTIRGVIEHLTDFKPLFSVLEKNLKKGGIVYMCATPDFSSPAAILYKERWNQISVPYHCHQFTQASIALLFAQNGFGLKALYHPYEDTPYTKSNDLKTFINNSKESHIINMGNTHHAYPGTMMSLIFIKK